MSPTLPLCVSGAMILAPMRLTVFGRQVIGEERIIPGYMVQQDEIGFLTCRPHPSQQIACFWIEEPNATDIEKHLFFNATSSAELTEIDTPFGPARILLSGSGQGKPSAWDRDIWHSDYAPIFEEVAREVMPLFGVLSAEQVQKTRRAFATRAAARVRARQTPTGNFGQAEITSRHLAYANFFAVEDLRVQTTTFSGDQSPILERAVFLGMDAAIVLPYDPVRDRVLLVEQIRMGPIGRADPGAWQLEPVAGHVDPGETPEEAARREAEEEAGLTLLRLEPVANCYPSPGASSEFYYIFVGLADLPDDVVGVSGVASEGEDIRSHLLSFDALMEMVDTRAASTAPVYLAAYWLARHRARLRSA